MGQNDATICGKESKSKNTGNCFIALGGIAVETAVIILLYIDDRVRKYPPKSQEDLEDAILYGAVLRLRPKLMTVSVIIAGLLPIFFTDGVGADVMRRIALPMVGGMASTTLLTLIVIPIIYRIWEGKNLPSSSLTKKGV